MERKFGITSSGQWFFYPSYQPELRIGPEAAQTTPNAAIKKGIGATNTLEVKVHGLHFDFFINGVDVGTGDDNDYANDPSTGSISFIVSSFNYYGDQSDAAASSNEAIFTNLDITNYTQ